MKPKPTYNDREGSKAAADPVSRQGRRYDGTLLSTGKGAAMKPAFDDAATICGDKGKDLFGGPIPDAGGLHRPE